MVGAVTCFTALDTTAKWTSQTLPPLQTVALRYVASFVFIVLVCRPWRRLGVLRSNARGLQVARAVSLVCATVCAFTALHYLPLGQVTAIAFASPLVVAALAGPLLGEWPGPRRWAAVLVGFVGVLIVTRPGATAHWAVGVAMLSAVANSAYALLTRRLAGRDQPLTTLFWSGWVGAVLVAPVPAVAWVPPPGSVWAALVLMGVLATTGHLLLILANERATASTLAPFTYSQMVTATLLGFLVFGDVPDGWTVVGGAIVGASGLAMLFIERGKG